MKIRVYFQFLIDFIFRAELVAGTEGIMSKPGESWLTQLPVIREGGFKNNIENQPIDALARVLIGHFLSRTYQTTYI